MLGVYKFIATFLLQFGQFAFGWWWKIKTEKGKIRAQNNLERVQAVSDVMEDIRRATPAKRVFIVRTENSGKVIKPGVDWYGTITDETTNRDVGPAKPHFQRILLDSSYKELVVRVGRVGRLFINRDETQPNTLIGEVLRTDGVGFAMAYKIRFEEKRQFFLVLQFDDNTILSVPPKMFAIRSKVDQIRDLMKD